MTIQGHLPYREPGKTDAYPQQTYGLIIKEDHFCKPPGKVRRIILFFQDHPVKNGSLWRCHCGKVFAWRTLDSDGDVLAYPGWQKASTKNWIDAGGFADSNKEQLNKTNTYIYDGY